MFRISSSTVVGRCLVRIWCRNREVFGVLPGGAGCFEEGNQRSGIRRVVTVAAGVGADGCVGKGAVLWEENRGGAARHS